MPSAFEITSLLFPAESEIPRLVLESRGGIECLKYLDEEYLVRAGEARQEVFLVVKGSCLVQREGASAERRPGDELAVIEATPESPVFIGETAYLSGGPRTASVRSALSVWALRMQPQHLDFIIAKFPALTAMLCHQFAKRLKETNAALAQLRERLAMDVSNAVVGQGDALFYRGDDCTALHILVDGVVELEGDGGFREVRPGSDGPCFLNAAAFVRRGRETHSARATSTAMINTIPMASREAAIRNFPQLVDAVL